MVLHTLHKKRSFQLRISSVIVENGQLKMGFRHFSNFSFSLKYNFCRKSYEKIPFLRSIFQVEGEMAPLKIFIKIGANVLFLCLLFPDLKNVTYFSPRSVQHVWVFDYCKLGLHNKLIICKIQVFENSFPSFSFVVISFFSLWHK